jgi:hypothetical protein
MSPPIAPRRPRKRRAPPVQPQEPDSDPPIIFEEPALSKPASTVPVEEPPPEPPNDDAESYEVSREAAARLPDLN